MINLNDNQKEILKNAGWIFGTNDNTGDFAKNNLKGSELYGDFVFRFLCDEYEELLTSQYEEVEFLDFTLKEKGYEIVKIKPLEIKNISSGQICKGSAANWLIRELLI